MKLSKSSAYAALAVACLAQHRGGPVVQARVVATFLGIPTDSALKILQNLARHHIIQSQLGRGGGYHLHQTPEQISLLQVVEAIDGPVAASMPLHQGEGNLGSGVDLLRQICEQAAEQLRQRLATITIADLLASGEADRNSPAGQLQLRVG